MLEAWSKHGLMDLGVDAKGDLDVDLHHTVEDVGICLGKALREALGDKKGIVRYGASFLPMDEALLHAAVDISGRPYLVFNVPVQRTRISNFDLDLLKEFFRAFAFNAEITLHVTMHYGENLHHIAEAVFKAVGRALAEATRHQPPGDRHPLDQGRALRAKGRSRADARRLGCSRGTPPCSARRTAGWPSPSSRTTAAATSGAWRRRSSASACPP